MTYELALQLKEAGFESNYLRPFRDPDFAFDGIDYYAPTLEELIFAVGDQFLGVLRHDDGSGWTALKAGDVLFDDRKHSEGSTPSEAVANLWLTLQKRGA